MPAILECIPGEAQWRQVKPTNDITMTHAIVLRHTLRLAVLLAAPALAHAGPMHKCVQGQTVVYSDKPCASEQQAQVVRGGSVSTTDALQSTRREETLYYPSSSGKPQVPYFSRQKSVEDSLKERSIRR